MENEAVAEQWDIELYKNPSTGYIDGGAYNCVNGQIWHVEWSAFTTGFIIDFRQARVDTSPLSQYINSDTRIDGVGVTSGGAVDYVITATASNVKIGQRQWNNDNGCDANWIKIRITQP